MIDWWISWASGFNKCFSLWAYYRQDQNWAQCDHLLPCHTVRMCMPFLHLKKCRLNERWFVQTRTAETFKFRLWNTENSSKDAPELPLVLTRILPVQIGQGVSQGRKGYNYREMASWFKRDGGNEPERNDIQLKHMMTANRKRWTCSPRGPSRKQRLTCLRWTCSCFFTIVEPPLSKCQLRWIWKWLSSNLKNVGTVLSFCV